MQNGNRDPYGVFFGGSAMVHDVDAAYFLIQPDAVSKEEFFVSYYRSINLPEDRLPYWGRNWDALDETLCTFDWLRTTTVIVDHRRVPILNQNDLKKYFGCVRYSASVWHERGGKKVFYRFEESVRDIFLSLTHESN